MRKWLTVLVAAVVVAAVAGSGRWLMTRSLAGPRTGRSHPARHSERHSDGPSPSPGGSSPSAADPPGPDRVPPEPLRPGERPPQFIVVSFDGAGWHEMWQHWWAVADRVPFRFTGFLSGTYLLSSATRQAYRPPHLPPGTSNIGWRDAADVPVEIEDLNRALAKGMEIGTHFNGHFCADDWTTADWDAELDQFFSLVAHVDRNNHLSMPRLDLKADDVRGARTPCLGGSPATVDPALRRHGIEYDASFSRNGLAWPTRSADGIWQLGMPVFPIHGALPDGRTGVPVTAMDYNYWAIQRGAKTDGVTPEQSARDSRQVLETYRDMYHAAYAGNRAPLILGNHFNDWNRGAYRDALTRFVLETCDQPQTECVTYRELVDWLEAQPRRMLDRLQELPPERAPR